MTLLISAGYYLGSGEIAAYSSLLGGMIFVLPQLYFGVKAFMYSGARSIQKIVISFYKGESSKLVIIALSFGLIFKFVEPLDYFALYTTFICVLVMNCFSALIDNTPKSH
jgi:ATP synthase protein I